MKWEIFIKNWRKIRIYKAKICLRRQVDDSPSPHVAKRKHLANPPSPVYVVCVWPPSLIPTPKFYQNHVYPNAYYGPNVYEKKRILYVKFR